jgi:tripartite-type tricarboxylate transporter receptor subunit TctC
MLLVLPETEGSQSAILYGIMQRFVRQKTAFSLALRHLPGRGGSYAWNFLQDAPDNGYRLAALTLPSVMLLAADKNRVFSPESVAPVAVFAYAANALWVAEDSDFNTVEELVDYSRKPGNTLRIAGTGSYTDHHMADMVFKRAAGIRTTYMPFTGTAESVAAVRQKRAVACWGYALAGSSMPGLRPLAVAHPERCPVLPNTPTFREHNMDVVGGQYFGLAAPATVRKKIREEVSAFFLDLFADKSLRDEAVSAGFMPADTAFKDMPAFMERQYVTLEGFLADYAMFPKERLPVRNSFNAREDVDAPDRESFEDFQDNNAVNLEVDNFPAGDPGNSVLQK